MTTTVPHPNRELLLEIASAMPKHELAIYQPIVYEPIHQNINMFYVEIFAENYVEALVKFFDLMNENMKKRYDFYDFNSFNLPLNIDSDFSDLTGWELWKIDQPFDSHKYGGMTIGKKEFTFHKNCDEDCSDCQRFKHLPKHFKID
jgi:hypothetical protein